MDIEHKRSLESTAKHLRQSAESFIQQAQSIEQLSSEAEPVHRVSADSLRRLQSNLAASSNGSLKRATELGALHFVDERSCTLDARRANDQVELLFVLFLCSYQDHLLLLLLSSKQVL